MHAFFDWLSYVAVDLWNLGLHDTLSLETYFLFFVGQNPHGKFEDVKANNNSMDFPNPLLFSID